MYPYIKVKKYSVFGPQQFTAQKEDGFYTNACSLNIWKTLVQFMATSDQTHS